MTTHQRSGHGYLSRFRHLKNIFLKIHNWAEAFVLLNRYIHRLVPTPVSSCPLRSWEYRKKRSTALQALVGLYHLKGGLLICSRLHHYNVNSLLNHQISENHLQRSARSILWDAAFNPLLVFWNGRKSTRGVLVFRMIMYTLLAASPTKTSSSPLIFANDGLWVPRKSKNSPKKH